MSVFHPAAWVMALSLTLATPAMAQQAKPSAAQNLAAYAGVYELAPGATLTVTYEKEHLFAQMTGQDKYEVFPAGPNEVEWKVVEAKATFQRAPDGHTTGLIIHQNGMDVPAKKAN
jgi:hypothetical protein